MRHDTVFAHSQRWRGFANADRLLLGSDKTPASADKTIVRPRTKEGLDARLSLEAVPIAGDHQGHYCLGVVLTLQVRVEGRLGGRGLSTVDGGRSTVDCGHFP